MILHKLFSRIEARSGNKSFSLWRTVYFNFRTLPFRQAIKLPLRIYGKITFGNLDGTIILPSMSVWKIGRNYAGYRNTAPGRICLLSGSKFILHPNVCISQGANIIVHRDATLELKTHSTVGDSADIICYKHISVGEHSDITWQCQVMDFNSHFIRLADGTIPSIFKPVNIGNYCWIGNRSSIMPGTILPDRTIVSSNSLCNKDLMQPGGG